MEEVRIYIVNNYSLAIGDNKDYDRVSDEEFITEAERQGTVYSLDEYIDRLNEECGNIRPGADYIRRSKVHDGYFKITSVHRTDLQMRGFDVSNVSDDTMEALASRMGSVYVDQMFFDSMEDIAESIGIPRTEKEEEQP